MQKCVACTQHQTDAIPNNAVNHGSRNNLNQIVVLHSFVDMCTVCFFLLACDPDHLSNVELFCPSLPSEGANLNFYTGS